MLKVASDWPVETAITAMRFMGNGKFANSQTTRMGARE